MLKRLFTEHPATVDETYGEHFLVAAGFAWQLLVASLACLLHAFLPCLCVKTGSRMIGELHQRMVTGRHRHPERLQARPASSR